MTNKNTRIGYIDIAKGIGILLMVIGHMVSIFPIRQFIFQFHMPMFLIFSGFLFNDKKWGGRKTFTLFLQTRFRQLLVPYACFFILILVVSLLQKPDIDYITTIYNGPPPAIWFLLDLFIVEILFWIVNRINSNTYFHIINIFIVLFIGRWFEISNISFPYCLSSIPVCYVFYVLGFLSKQLDFITSYNTKRHRLKSLFVNAMTQLFVVMLYVIITRNHTDLMFNHIELWGYITAFLGTSGIVGLSVIIQSESDKMECLLRWIGQNSISFIGLNCLLIGICDIIIKPYMPSFSVYKGIQFIITFSVCALFALFANRYIPLMVGKRYRKIETVSKKQ